MPTAATCRCSARASGRERTLALRRGVIRRKVAPENATPSLNRRLELVGSHVDAYFRLEQGPHVCRQPPVGIVICLCGRLYLRRERLWRHAAVGCLRRVLELRFRVAQIVERFVEVGHRRWRNELSADIDRLAEAQYPQQGLRYFERRKLCDAPDQQRTADRQAEDEALIAIDVEFAVGHEQITPAGGVDVG